MRSLGQFFSKAKALFFAAFLFFLFAPKGAAKPDTQTNDGVMKALYYKDVNLSLKDQRLKDALQKKLSRTHKRLSYKKLWDAFTRTDTHRCEGVFDFYSSKCFKAEEKCRNFKREGDCFNREHSWPKSWYKGKKSSTPYTDLIVIVPSDGYVNSRRGNLPYGHVDVAKYVSSNGSKMGACKNAEAGKRCFEPIDSLKGDFARIYFYFSVRYQNVFLCCDKNAVDGAKIKAWQEELLRQWHEQDPVDEAERKRNARIFLEQKNRNPFVDFPKLVSAIADF